MNEYDQITIDDVLNKNVVTVRRNHLYVYTVFMYHHYDSPQDKWFSIRIFDNLYEALEFIYYKELDGVYCKLNEM